MWLQLDFFNHTAVVENLMFSLYMTWQLRDLHGVLKSCVTFKARVINLSSLTYLKLCVLFYEHVHVAFHPQGIHCFHEILKIGHDQVHTNH